MLELYLDNVKLDMPLDFKVNMTYQSSDLSKPDAKINNYSKTIKVAGTKNNNKIFGNIYRFDTNIISSDSLIGISFDPNKKVPFVLLYNGEMYEEGYAKLDKIDVKNNIIEYNITLYGMLGQFFYNLNTKEDGEKKTLFDLTYGIIDLSGKKLSPKEENERILFEYDNKFITDSWNIINNKIYIDNDYDNIDDNNILKLICPVVCHQGHYEDFNSDTVLVNVNGLNDDCILKKTFTDDESVYSNYKGWVKVQLDREVSPFEIDDVRSHYMPYGIRLQAIYDAIKNPINNGGFIVDDSNVTDVDKKYLYEGFILREPFVWSDINANNINTTIYSTWSSLEVSTNTPSHTITDIDLTNYISPNATVHLYPRILTTWYNPNVEGNCWAWPCAYKTSKRDVDGFFGQSCQAFWVTSEDSNNNLNTISDVYLYGDKLFDDNGKFAGKLYMPDTDTDKFTDDRLREYILRSTIDKQPYIIKEFLNKTGLLLDYNRLTPSERTIYSGYTTTNNGVIIKFPHLYDGYNANDGNYNAFNGKELSIPIKLLNNSKKLTAHTYSFTYEYRIKPISNVNDPNFPLPDFNSIYDVKISNGFTFFSRFEYTQFGKWTPTGFMSYYYNRGVGDPCSALGELEDKSQIYDGNVETRDERHTVDKFTLFQNTNSPYEYLINIGKLFNWKFEYKNDKIYIYSFKNYYKNNIIDINDKADYTTVNIIPTTHKDYNYNIYLDVDEDNYVYKTWYKKYKEKYGQVILPYTSEFLSESKNILDDIDFKTTIPYMETSVFFNDVTKQPLGLSEKTWPIPTLGKYVNITCFNSNKDTYDSRLKGLLRVLNGRLSQSEQDDTVRLSFFDKDYQALEMNDTIVFYNAEYTVDQSKLLNITNNIESTKQLTDGNCYIWGFNLSVNNSCVDVDNDIYNIPSVAYEFPPVFSTHFKYNDTELGSFKFENNEPVPDPIYKYAEKTDIYGENWRNYLGDLYDKNNKIITLKVRLNSQPQEAMKNFYTFKNAIFMLNKVVDYSPSDIFTKCEFIQIQDVDSYVK